MKYSEVLRRDIEEPGFDPEVLRKDTEDLEIDNEVLERYIELPALKY